MRLIRFDDEGNDYKPTNLLWFPKFGTSLLTTVKIVINQDHILLLTNCFQRKQVSQYVLIKYIINGIPYLGKGKSREPLVPLGELVTMKWAERHVGCERNITTDNFFTSLPLAIKLLAKKLQLLGQLRQIEKSYQDWQNWKTTTWHFFQPFFNSIAQIIVCWQFTKTKQKRKFRFSVQCKTPYKLKKITLEHRRLFNCIYYQIWRRCDWPKGQKLFGKI